MQKRSFKRNRASERRASEGNRNLASVCRAVAGILELRKEIAEGNKGKPKLKIDEVKSWIEKGRRV